MAAALSSGCCGMGCAAALVILSGARPGLGAVLVGCVSAPCALGRPARRVRLAPCLRARSLGRCRPAASGRRLWGAWWGSLRRRPSLAGWLAPAPLGCCGAPLSVLVGCLSACQLLPIMIYCMHVAPPIGVRGLKQQRKRRCQNSNGKTARKEWFFLSDRKIHGKTGKKK